MLEINSADKTCGSLSQGIVVELQALRGAAALTVLMHHCLFYYKYNENLKAVLGLAFNPHAAVVVFFVLSGFVLSSSLIRHPISSRSIFGFYIKRCFRIYPALWIACILGLMYCKIFHSIALPPTVSTWWDPQYRSTQLTISHVMLTTLGIKAFLPLPIWTLLIELIGSALLPFLVLAWQKSAPTFLILMLSLTAIAFIRDVHVGNVAFIFRSYLVSFALGVVVFGLASKSRSFFRSTKVSWLATFISIIGLGFGRYMVGGDLDANYHLGVAAVIEALFAALLISVINARADLFPILRQKWAIRIGDNSYSLYLFHLPIMAMIAGLAGERIEVQPFVYGGFLATVFLLICTISISSIAATLSYKFVEIPSIRVGKFVLSWLNIVE